MSDEAELADKLERGLAALYMSDGKNAAEAAATELIYLTALAIPLLRRPPSPPAPEGWRPIDFMSVKQCSECSSRLCATAYGMTGVIVVFDNREAAEAYQRAMLASTPAPPAHAELAGRLRELSSALLDTPSKAMTTVISARLLEAANVLSPLPPDAP